MEKSKYSSQLEHILNLQNEAIKCKELKKLADAGDADAQEMLGVLYIKGVESFYKSPLDALHYFKLASEQGKGYSQYMVFSIMTTYKECLRTYVITEHSIPFQYLLQSVESKYAGGVIAIAYLYTFSSSCEEIGIGDLKYQIPINFEKAESYLDLLNDKEIDENVFKLKYGLKDQIEKLRIAFAKTSKKEGCYIATAVYGSYNAKEVRQLRKFRDEVLLQNVIGKWFVKIYYLLSPPIAKYLKNMNWLNTRVKMLLDYFVKRLE